MLAELASESGYTAVEKPDGYDQGQFEPVTDGVEYINFNAGKPDTYKLVENDFYAMQLLNGAKTKNILVNDEATAKAIAEKALVKLIFNEQNVVVGIVE